MTYVRSLTFKYCIFLFFKFCFFQQARVSQTKAPGRMLYVEVGRVQVLWRSDYKGTIPSPCSVNECKFLITLV